MTRARAWVAGDRRAIQEDGLPLQALAPGRQGGCPGHKGENGGLDVAKGPAVRGELGLVCGYSHRSFFGLSLLAGYGSCV